jgi:hypothetical protein
MLCVASTTICTASCLHEDAVLIKCDGFIRGFISVFFIGPLLDLKCIVVALFHVICLKLEYGCF